MSSNNNNNEPIMIQKVGIILNILCLVLKHLNMYGFIQSNINILN